MSTPSESIVSSSEILPPTAGEPLPGPPARGRFPAMPPEALRAVGWALLVTTLLALLIILGSRNLAHFDAALVGYTFATLFAAFGITYRYSIWLSRPPTAVYWRRGWQLFFRRGHMSRNLRVWFQKFTGMFALNNFIWRRGRYRWAAHWLIMWGCIIAAAITFPLVFGWIHFQSPADDLTRYQVFLFGFPTVRYRVDSPFAFLIFHGLVWSSFFVIAGVMIAMRRRMVDHGARALQQFGEDILPLLLLFAISITGLMLAASYTWLRGYAYDFLAITHAVTVIVTLLYLPFGKLFHIFQRPAQLGVAFYRDQSLAGEQTTCARCGDEYASRMHVEDLIEVERRLGYRYEMPGDPAAHYQRVCPRCRRAMLGIAQGRLWQGARGEGLIESSPALVDIANMMSETPEGALNGPNHIGGSP